MQKYEPMSQLKAKRIEKNLTQQQLSDLVGIRQNLLSCYESGIYFPRRKVLDKLAKALECEVKDIVGGETMDKKLTDKNKQDKDGELLLTFDSFMKLFDAYRTTDRLTCLSWEEWYTFFHIAGFDISGYASWSRSGYNSHACLAYFLGASGGTGGNSVTRTDCVRPALHFKKDLEVEV